jgi:hypothetical protein
MPRKPRVIALGLLLFALALSIVQALPLIPQSHAVQRVEASDLVTAARNWLAFLLCGHRPTAGHRHGSPVGQEKEGNQLDPNGHQ